MGIAAFFLSGALHPGAGPVILNESPKLRDRKGHVRSSRQFAKDNVNLVSFERSCVRNGNKTLAGNRLGRNTAFLFGSF